MLARSLALAPFLLAALAATAHAQHSLTGTSTTIDFTGYTAAGFAPTPTAAQLDSDTWRPRGHNEDTTVEFGDTHTTGDFARGATASHPTTGGQYVFTSAPGAPGLGVQGGGDDFTPGTYTLKLVNNTGAVITEMVVSYQILVYNDETRGNTFNFAHDADDVGTYTSVAAASFTTPAAADGAPAWMATSREVTLTGLNLANGANYYLQWQSDDSLGTGNRDEIVLDDIVIAIPGCGDSVVNGAEECDDGMNGTGDGCDDSCQVEAGFACDRETSVCTAGCGDGVPGGEEECDDAIPAENGDGCSDICRVEPGYACDAATPSACAPVCGDDLVIAPETCEDDDGTPTAGDGCDASCQLEPGWSCPTAGMACVGICGNGTLQGAETCDDGDALGGDGCSATCTTETGYTCATPGAACTSDCGDSLVAIGAETCDDGDEMGGDGCSATCATESGWTCAAPGAACTTTCGDGIPVGAEACDDGDGTGGDGCSSTCLVEHGFECTGAPSTCASDCGDGEVASNEECDDSGMDAGDGCDEGCSVETGWVCSKEPSVCVEDTLCGNGTLDGVEECDDGAREDGDGCSDSCTVEFGFVCDGEPSDCVADGDDDGVPDDEDNCPDVANPLQPDDDEDGEGNACDEDTAVPGPEGCCAVGAGTDERAGWLLLGAFVMLGLRRRRR